MSFPHLSENAASKLDLSDAERIEHIKKPRWIPYKRAEAILDRLEDLFTYPKQPRMPSMLIIGETNNGKTLLIDRFTNRHPPDDNAKGEHIKVPVLQVQVPSGADEGGLYTCILSILFQSIPSTGSVATKRERAVSLLRRLEVQVLIFDEVQRLLDGPGYRQKLCMEALKYLGNELRVPVIGVGRIDIARAMNTDLQLANRFRPEILPLWKKGAEFQRLLASFERIIPLRNPSQMATNAQIVDVILKRTGGLIGEVSLLLNETAIWAIQNKIEQITLDSIAKSEYRSPAENKELVDSL